MFFSRIFANRICALSLVLSLVHFVVVILVVYLLKDLFRNFMHVSGVSIALCVSLTLRIRRVACTCVYFEAARVNESER